MWIGLVRIARDKGSVSTDLVDELVIHLGWAAGERG